MLGCMVAASTKKMHLLSSISLSDCRISIRWLEFLRHATAHRLAGFITLAAHLSKTQRALPIAATARQRGISELFSRTLGRQQNAGTTAPIGSIF